MVAGLNERLKACRKALTNLIIAIADASEWMCLAQPTSQKLDACIVGRGPDGRTARSQPMLRCLLQILNGDC